MLRHIFSLGIIVTGDCIIMSTFRAHIVACDNTCRVLRKTLSPIDTYCRQRQYMPGFTEHIVAHRHILSPATIHAGFYGTHCRPSTHIVACDDICRTTVVCVCREGKEGEGGKERETHRQIGQIFNNYIFDDAIKFSSTLF